jgi:integrase
MLIAAGVDPKTISRLMGHSSVAFTLDQYAKVFARHERTMLDRFDAYLASPPPLVKGEVPADPGTVKTPGVR